MAYDLKFKEIIYILICYMYLIHIEECKVHSSIHNMFTNMTTYLYTKFISLNIKSFCF